MTKISEAKYKIIDREGKIELREYTPSIVAEVEIEGELGRAGSKGFKILADYIFGSNEIPSDEDEGGLLVSQKIAMIAPVNCLPSGVNKWQVQFYMPENYNLDTLPKPKNHNIALREIPAEQRVALRFTGFISEETVREKTEEVMEYVKSHHMTALSAPVLARFNPPWTIPFLRRNEIQITVGII